MKYFSNNNNNNNQKLKLFLVLLAIIGLFFLPILKGQLPIPSDTVLGLYHPWRDKIYDNLTAGVPFKKFLITDPVRQQIPWKTLVVESLKKFELPLWNQYNFAGTPLLANFQSAVFYPLNLIFLILPFNLSWTILIISQFILAGLFMFLYLENLSLKKEAVIIGTITFIYSGFFTAWGEWGNILSTALWLPLILFVIDKIKAEGFKIKWIIIFILSLVCSFFAGHLQIAFYVLVFSIIYIIARFWNSPNKVKTYLIFFFLFFLFTILTTPQWLPTLQFINQSSRSIDQVAWNRPDWFLPFQNLVQFIAPDFFGNPTTLNYFGVFNYAEFVGYIGIVPLVALFYAVFRRKDKKVLFYTLLGLVLLSFTLPTPWAKIPFILTIPLLSTSQPSRLIFLVIFCFSIVSALGLDQFLKKEDIKKDNKDFLLISLLTLLIIPFLWFGISISKNTEIMINLKISQNNLILPGILLLILTFLLIIKSKTSMLSGKVFTGVIILLLLFDLGRFWYKFTPFTKSSWLFPSTNTIRFLKENLGFNRFATTDGRMFPPNFGIMYKLPSVDGYDPLYLSRYAEMISASERNSPNINPPFGFNRIITPRNHNSRILDLLGVKYFLSFNNLEGNKYAKVYEEGATKIFENKSVFPRVFMVGNVLFTQNKQESIEALMNNNIDLQSTVVIEKDQEVLFENDRQWKDGTVTINKYENNEIIITINAKSPSILILTDTYYPTWQATIDSVKTKIIRVDYTLRGVVVPQGEHEVKFIAKLF